MYYYYYVQTLQIICLIRSNDDIKLFGDGNDFKKSAARINNYCIQINDKRLVTHLTSCLIDII